MLNLPKNSRFNRQNWSCRNEFDNNVVTNSDLALTFLQTPFTLLSFLMTCFYMPNQMLLQFKHFSTCVTFKFFAILQNYMVFRSFSIFSCESSSRSTNVRSSIRSFVRQDTLTLTAYKSLCRFRTYKCEVSLEPYTQGLLI